MLILTRKPGENIRLFLEDGREIRIEIYSLGNNEYSRIAKIGIDAPKSINIVRGELLIISDSSEIEEGSQEYYLDSHNAKCLIRGQRF